ncbi:MAG: hypothetical protein GX801_10445 [Fibrobacter sp.]|nr:hypothetical protein [Fibrobacter sp.]
MTFSLGVLLVAYALVGLLLAYTALNLNALHQKVNEFSEIVKQRYQPSFLEELEKKAAAKVQEVTGTGGLEESEEPLKEAENLSDDSSVES